MKPRKVVKFGDNQGIHRRIFSEILMEYCLLRAQTQKLRIKRPSKQTAFCSLIRITLLVHHHICSRNKNIVLIYQLENCIALFLPEQVERSGLMRRPVKQQLQWKHLGCCCSAAFPSSLFSLFVSPYQDVQKYKAKESNMAYTF